MDYYEYNSVEDPMDAFPAEKYFDHYGWLNYIDSPYKDPELAQPTGKVLEKTAKNNIRAKMIQKSKRILKRGTCHEPPRHDSSPTKPEPKDPSQDTGDITIQQSPTVSLHKQGAKRYFTEEEEAWLDLFHAKLRVAVEDGTAIKLPGAILITEAMNSYFASKHANCDENELTPRTVESLRGKLDRTWLHERKRLRSMLGGGRTGVVYVPSITAGELEAYQGQGVVAYDMIPKGEGIDPGESGVADIDAGEKEVTDGEGSPGRKRRRLV
ncbi:hypothetical protein yc1106_08918 [Curvularia clavata]|uniref:Uncharacterized protein n=1 Tax=Curvularia clavata TaxID=95742 RepID=A0A9Q8ZFC8_CURCL|nr:hypothetical protein yc1106_08918 [Curvularia clavata]